MSDRVRALNDLLRRRRIGGRTMLTASVAALPLSEQVKVLTAVQEFSDFTPDNDPHDQHDFAFFEIDNERYFFKIDCYNRTLTAGSENPAEQRITTRVLTIGHASEY